MNGNYVARDSQECAVALNYLEPLLGHGAADDGCCNIFTFQDGAFPVASEHGIALFRKFKSLEAELSATKEKLERLNGLVDMQAEALQNIIDCPNENEGGEPWVIASKALSASSDTVSAYKREVQADALENLKRNFEGISSLDYAIQVLSQEINRLRTTR